MSAGRTYVLDLVLVEVGDHVDDDPGQGAPEVDQLMQDERHDAGSQDVVLHVGVPRSPHAF